MSRGWKRKYSAVQLISHYTLTGVIQAATERLVVSKAHFAAREFVGKQLTKANRANEDWAFAQSGRATTANAWLLCNAISRAESSIQAILDCHRHRFGDAIVRRLEAQP